MKNKMFEGSKAAIITFFVSLGMSFVMFLTGVLTLAIPRRSVGGNYGNDDYYYYTTLYTNGTFYVYSGTNNFTFTPSSSDDYEIYISSSSDRYDISRIKVTRASGGSTVYNSTTISTYNEFSLSAGVTYIITITASSSATFVFRYY